MGGRNSGSGYKENKNQMVTILSKGRMIINKAAGKIKNSMQSIHVRAYSDP